MTINERVSLKKPLFAEVHNVPDDYRFTTEELDRIISGDMFTPRQDAIMARELQQYRAAAEKPIGSFHIIDQQVDGTTDYVKDGEWPIDNGELLVYAAPQVTSVPEEATPESIEVLASVRPPHGVAFQLDGYERKLASDIWNACRGAMLTGEGETAAPAVQAEQEHKK
ncbi:hypothetical protein ATHEMM101B_10100 [Atlantibacter hermannii]|uniref:hypothetical protein n=1 Tax=Atlantibacter hermannii TaxID=565 RepID=UPI003B247CE4